MPRVASSDWVLADARVACLAGGGCMEGAGLTEPIQPGPAVQSRRPGGRLQGSAVEQRGGSKTARSGLLLGFQEETRGTYVMPLRGLWPRQSRPQRARQCHWLCMQSR